MTNITREAYIPFRDGLTQRAAANLAPEQIVETIDAYRAALDEAEKTWRCFHCGETFTNERDACLHFGATERETAACQIDGGVLAELRKANHELDRYRDEDSAKDREMYAQRSAHAVALKRAEEDGHAKGLHAAPEYSHELQRERDAAIARAEEAEKLLASALSYFEHEPEGHDDGMAFLEFAEQSRAALAKEGGGHG